MMTIKAERMRTKLEETGKALKKASEEFDRLLAKDDTPLLEFYWTVGELYDDIIDPLMKEIEDRER